MWSLSCPRSTDGLGGKASEETGARAARGNFDMPILAKKYRFAMVCFQNSRKPYAYLCKDPFVAVNSVVVVPAADGEPKPAIVAGIIVCTAREAPYPPEKAKSVLRRVNRSEKALFAGVDMRKTVDISLMRVQTRFGPNVLVTTREQREKRRRAYSRYSNVRIIETKPPISEKQQQLNWRAMNMTTQEAVVELEDCLDEMKRTLQDYDRALRAADGRDPLRWIDELEAMDALFGD